MPTWLAGTAKVSRNTAFAALAAALVASWLLQPGKAAGRDPYYGVVVDPDVDIGQAIPRLSQLGVNTVRLRMDVKDWSRPEANTAETDRALSQATALEEQGFRVVLLVDSVGGAVPSYVRASALFGWLLRRPGARAVKVVEVLGPVTDHASNADALSTTLPMSMQASHYVNGPLKAAWDVLHDGGKRVLGAAFTLWQQAEDFSSVRAYTFAVTKAYLRAGYLRYVDYAGLQPYVGSPASQVTWVRQAKALFSPTPVWISEWGLNRDGYPTVDAYSKAMTQAVTGLRRLADVVCYAKFTASDPSEPELAEPGLSGYRRVQPAYDTYRSWPKQ